MSSALAIAAVSAALKDYLENRLAQFAAEASLNDVKVTLTAPDRINLGTEEPNQVNLFLYRISPNASLRHNASRPASKTTANATPPAMSLDLHYLLTIYGAEPLSCETLLGCVVHAMQQATPDRLRASLRTVSQDASSAGRAGGKSAVVRAAAASSKQPRLSESAIAQFEMKLTPQFLSMEDMSKLWSSLQAKYRLSISYQISGVVMGDFDS